MLVTLTTDFGTGGRYVAEMKGVLYSQAPGVTVVDLSHEVPPQDIAAGARLLEFGTTRFPDGTVHLAVVDPGVGTDRAIVAIRASGQFYLGPDNGLFGWLTNSADAIVALDLERFDHNNASTTFHGRDLMAPAAALLAKGTALSELGPPRQELVLLPSTPEPIKSDQEMTGQVVEIDHYGNLITNLRPVMLSGAPLDERLRITLGVHETFGLWRTYAQQPPQTLVALVGSTGFIELAVVNGSAARMLRAGVGDAVRLSWGEASS